MCSKVILPGGVPTPLFVAYLLSFLVLAGRRGYVEREGPDTMSTQPLKTLLLYKQADPWRLRWPLMEFANRSSVF